MHRATCSLMVLMLFTRCQRECFSRCRSRLRNSFPGIDRERICVEWFRHIRSKIPEAGSHNLLYNHPKRTQSRQRRRVTGNSQKLEKMALQATKFNFSHEFWTTRPRERHPDILDHPARSCAHHDDSVGKKEGFVDVVRHKKCGGWNLRPDIEQNIVHHRRFYPAMGHDDAETLPGQAHFFRRGWRHPHDQIFLSRSCSRNNLALRQSAVDHAPSATGPLENLALTRCAAIERCFNGSRWRFRRTGRPH
jgi:hypothetical protein